VAAVVRTKPSANQTSELLKMSKPTTRKAGANMQSETEDAQTEKSLCEMIAALRSEITLLKDKVEELRKDITKLSKTLMKTPH